MSNLSRCCTGRYRGRTRGRTARSIGERIPDTSISWLDRWAWKAVRQSRRQEIRTTPNKSFDNEMLMVRALFRRKVWLPKCEIGFVTHAVVRDRASGVTIHDTAGSTHFDCSRLPQAFRTPRDVDMVAEINLAEDSSAQPLSCQRRPNYSNSRFSARSGRGGAGQY